MCSTCCHVFLRLKSTTGGGKREAKCNFYTSIGRLLEVLGRGGEIPPTFGPSGGGEITPGGEIPPHSGTVTGGRNPPPGGISPPLKNMFTKSACTFFVCTAHEFDNNPALLHSYILYLE